MDIFEQIAIAQSLSDSKRKECLIPLLEDVISLATGEHTELSLEKKIRSYISEIRKRTKAVFS